MSAPARPTRMRSLQTPMWLMLLAVAMPVGAQDAADWLSGDGILYYTAAGTHASGHMAMGLDHTGANQTDFAGCAHMILRDRPKEMDVGKMSVVGRMGGQIVLVDFSSFSGSLEEMDGGIAQDIYVDGSHLHVGEIQHPAVFAGVAGWGHASLLVGLGPYPDPVTGLAEYQASMFVTPNGFRDDETGRIHDRDGGQWEPGEHARLGRDDWEVHLRIESTQSPRQGDAVYTFQQPPDAVGYFTPSEAYADAFLFDNVRYGGSMTVEIQAEALADAGQNALTFGVRDPHGRLLDEVTLAPALLQPDSHTVQVPLDTFGPYSITVHGKVSLSRYTITTTQHTPDDFDMVFWWDNTTFAGDSTRTLWDCQDEVGYVEALVANVVPRNVPPPFDWVPIGVGMSAGVLGVIIGGKLTHMTYTSWRRR